MTTAIETPVTPAPTASPRRGGSVVLIDLDWGTYRKILDAFGERRFRHTYDRGRLEIMSPLYWHDHVARALGIMIRGLAAEYGRKVKSAGSTTLGREDVDRGLEPDECFYIGSFAAIQGRRELDFDTDPPPDLAVESDNTRSSLDRLGVYAALGVPEVWRYRNAVLEVRALRPDGSYELVPESPTFPGIRSAELVGWIDRAIDLDDNELLDQFRAWVRQQRGSRP